MPKKAPINQINRTSFFSVSLKWEVSKFATEIKFWGCKIPSSSTIVGPYFLLLNFLIDLNRNSIIWGNRRIAPIISIFFIIENDAITAPTINVPVSPGKIFAGNLLYIKKAKKAIVNVNR